MSKKGSNWPDLTRRVASDSFTVTGPDGQEYHPHKGEWVILRQHITPALLQASLWLWGAKGSLTRDTAHEFAANMANLVDRMAAVIVDWNWTGPDGEDYPKPSAETLSKYLSFDELSWLSGEIQGGAKAENPTTPPSST